MKGNIQLIKVTLDFELVKLLECRFFLLLDFLVLFKRFCIYNTISKTLYRYEKYKKRLIVLTA